MSPFHLSGPTAVGKSAVALELAKRVGGEILSVDSMQVFRGMDVGTAKPGIEERRRVAHHLIDLVDVDEPFSAARWLEEAGRVESVLTNQSRVPVYCGGTGLYFQLLREGLHASAPPDPRWRAELEASPLSELLAELERDDPEAFGRIDRRNPRRVIRAVEILRGGGRQAGAGLDRNPPESAVSTPGMAGRHRPPLFFLQRSPDDQRRRIDARVDRMFEAGLVDETRRLLERGLRTNRVALQAIGYRQVVEYFDGVRDLAATRELVKSRTWQYARRQHTWFRHRPGVVRLEVTAEETADETAERILGYPEGG